MTKKKLVVVTPTFNEEANIGSLIGSIFSQEKSLPGWQLSILIVDSRSSDQTAAIVKELSTEYKNLYFLDVKKRGLGLALSSGLDYAVKRLQADAFVTIESDLSNDPRQIPEFVARLRKADLVIGSRYMPGGQVVNWSWWRKSLSFGANAALKIFAWTNQTDEFTNLYRAFTKKVWQEIRSQVQIHHDWIFVPAFIFVALDAKLKITQQPIIYHDRFGGRSKMRTLSYTQNLLRYALRYWWHKHV